MLVARRTTSSIGDRRLGQYASRRFYRYDADQPENLKPWLDQLFIDEAGRAR
jgi:hypothetical protein